MKKKLLPLAAATTLMVSLTAPSWTAAGSVNDDIKELRQNVKEKQERQKELKQQLKQNERKQESIQSELDQLEESLEETREKIRQLNDDIAKTEAELEEARQKLKEAEARVQKRDKLFKERVRLMYENGQVSYLEVLLGAENFSDFLARFESIQTIMKQDKDLLEEQKRDRDLIAKAKQTIESSLAKLNTLRAEAEEQRELLAQKQKEKETALASLQREHAELEEISEKEAQRERELAAQLAAKVEAQQRQQSPSSGGGGGSGAAFRDSGGTLAWPVNGRFTSPYGPRNGRMHKGIDIAAPVGTPIYAAADGVVTAAGSSSGYGNRIIIAHGNGLSTLYAHMYADGILVSPGQSVKRGQQIAKVGNAGRSTGPHLHFEVLKGSTAVNPMNYLK